MELTKVDLRNIDRWIVSANRLIELGIRKPWFASELATFKKLDQLKREAEG